MNRQLLANCKIAALLGATLLGIGTGSGLASADAAWKAPESYEGKAYRVVLKVEAPEGEEPRPGNQRPAEAELDFSELLAPFGDGLRPDMTSVRVVPFDPATGEPVEQTAYAYAEGRYDVPWRWYDAAIGYDFPEFEANIDATNGALRYTNIPRFGYFYDCIGDWRQGHLAFTHQETNKREAWYAVFFDALPAGEAPSETPPRGFLGDGLHRTAPEGDSTTGLIHSRVEVFDWNNDGLVDLLVGSARGGVVLYPNAGKPGKPSFPYSKLVKTADGLPMDSGWSSTPCVVDWNGDGLDDLLLGSEWNRVMLYINRGKPGAPSYEYMGLVKTADGEPLDVPWEPCPEPQPHYTYTRDYYPVLEAVDWDGDGDIDLLAGGYVTGRIFLFENSAGPGKAPALQLVGPLEADGEPIDVGWAAAPAVADLDHDGDFDLVTGCMPMTEGGGDASTSENFVIYYRNDGDRENPKLHRMRLPRDGEFPVSSLGTPRFADWSNDGLLDLVVSAGTQIYLYKNIGSMTEPRFQAHGDRLPSQWSASGLPANQFIDWNGDGLPDAVSAPMVYLNAGKGSPGIFEAGFSVLKEGQEISHLSGVGDDWRYPRLYDLDGDGLHDYMDADHGGHFWWHRNQGTADSPAFPTEGKRLTLTSGEPINIGDGLEGFDALQGARPKYSVGDIDEDGLPDLVASNTLGMLFYFRQAEPIADAEAPVFEAPVRLGKHGNRPAVHVCDWNNDGRLDVVVASSASNAAVFHGQAAGSGEPFSEAEPIPLPKAPYGSGGPLLVVDYDTDGDQDIILKTAYGYTCLYESSFIKKGYAKAETVAADHIGNQAE